MAYPGYERDDYPPSYLHGGNHPMSYERPIQYPPSYDPARRIYPPERDAYPEYDIPHHYREDPYLERPNYYERPANPSSFAGPSRARVPPPSLPAKWDRPPALIAQPMGQPSPPLREPPRTHDRRKSAPVNSRGFEPSESWKQSNTHERRPSDSYNPSNSRARNASFSGSLTNPPIQRHRPSLLQSNNFKPASSSSTRPQPSWKDPRAQDSERWKPVDNGWRKSDGARTANANSNAPKSRYSPPRGRLSNPRVTESPSDSVSRSRLSTSIASSRSQSRSYRQRELSRSYSRSLSRERSHSRRSSTRSPSVDSLASSRASPVPGVIPVSPVLARAPEPPEQETNQQPVPQDRVDAVAQPLSPVIPKNDDAMVVEEAEVTDTHPAEDVPEITTEDTLDQIQASEDEMVGISTTVVSPVIILASPAAGRDTHMVDDYREESQSPVTTHAVPTILMEDVPPMSSANTLQDALRITAMRKFASPSSTRKDRISSVLAENLLHADEEAPSIYATPYNAEDLAEDFAGKRYLDLRQQLSNKIRADLIEKLQAKEKHVAEKAERLKAEYLALNEKWKVHCAKLDRINYPEMAKETLAVAAPSGRATRRTANIGDMARSDLEMEQIIASLGNDDATDPAHLSANNLAVIPDMISVVKGKVDDVYEDSNLRVENMAEYYAPDTGIDDWTPHEEKTFLQKYAQYPKQFGLIANFLPHKTAAACVTFYYLRKKEIIDFRKAMTRYAPGKRRRKKANGPTKKKTNALLADIIEHDTEETRYAGSPRFASGSGIGGAKGKGKAPAAAPLESRRSSRRLPQQPDYTMSTPEPSTSRPRRPRVALIMNEDGGASGSATPGQVATDEEEVDEKPKSKGKGKARAVTLELKKSSQRASRQPEAASLASTSTPEPAHRSKRSLATMVDEEVVSRSVTPASVGVGVDEKEGDESEQPKRKRPRKSRIKSVAVINDDADPGSTTPAPAPSTSTAASSWSGDDTILFMELFQQVGPDINTIASRMPGKSTEDVRKYHKSRQTRNLVLPAPVQPPPSATIVSANLQSLVQSPSLFAVAAVNGYTPYGGK